jgi:glycosyltransferase involved in cell wall biosynthesis
LVLTMARILLAVHSADAGGAQLMALANARHLAKRDRLIISIPDGSLREDFANLGELAPRCHSLPIWGASGRRWALQWTRTVRDALRMVRIIRRQRVEAVLVNSTVLIAPVLAARLARVPVLVHAREFPMTRGGRIVFALHARLADTVIAVSRAVLTHFTDGARARLVLIPDGIEIPPPPVAPLNGFHSPLRLCVIGSVNGLRSKGQDVAVAALGRLAAGGIDASLDLVGPVTDQAFAGELRASAARLGVSERVRIPGESREIEEVIAASDIVLMCSRIEPLGLVPAEALTRGRPVIAARTGGLPEVVLDGETGVLVAPDDPQALGDAVAALAAQPEMARRMTARGREDIAERLDIERSLESLSQELDQALGREGS